MNRAIIAVTSGGVKTAQRINQVLRSDIYALPQFCTTGEIQPIKTGLQIFMKDIFFTYRQIIMVMSCGIAVRSIAPYLQSKLTDPAVVVLDEKGRHAISLLSGHMGGANELAEIVASAMGGTAVITTASDNLDLPAVDMIAKKFGLVMENPELVKKVTASMVNGGKVALVTENWNQPVGWNLIPMTWEELLVPPDAVIYIGNRENPPESMTGIPIAKLIARNLVVGVGCRKGTGKTELLDTVRRLFPQHNLSMAAVKAVATIDLKKDEPAVIHLAGYLSADLEIVDRSEIVPVEHLFKSSPFVKDTVGVGCVCEPAAYIVSQKGKCLVPKTASNGITLCVFQKPETF